MSRHEKLRLLDILDAIDRIASYTEGMSYEGFLADRKTQDAVIHNVEIIGEAAHSLPADFVERHEDIPWNDIIGMRNVLVHQYFGILPDVAWDVIRNELPTLRAQIAKL
jgi:uncharacterized protein with HEPN domain